MKIEIIALILINFVCSCSLLKDDLKFSQIDERIKNSKFSTEYKLIKEIIEDTDVLIDKDNVYGCIANDFNEYGGCDACVEVIRDGFKIDELQILEENHETFYNGLEKEVKALIITTKMQGKEYGISFWFRFDTIDDKWCLHALYLNPHLI
jgi:hypothetical protein